MYACMCLEFACDGQWRQVYRSGSLFLGARHACTFHTQTSNECECFHTIRLQLKINDELKQSFIHMYACTKVNFGQPNYENVLKYVFLFL